jgi:hypothetical protein
MENKDVIHELKRYLIKYKTVDVIWFVEKKMKLTKDKREIDIITQGVVNNDWFTIYTGHNPKDVSIRYSKQKFLIFILTTIGGAVGLIGGILGIIAFFSVK